MNNDTDENSLPGKLYLDLLKKCLTRTISSECYERTDHIKYGRLGRLVNPLVKKWLDHAGLTVVRLVDIKERDEGRDWPIDAETMIGLKRLDNLQFCIEDVIRQKVPGDLIETGVWRGGTTIFMRAVLKIYGETDRIVWVADSFQGLPKSDPEKYPVDEGDIFWTFDELKVSLEDVKENFKRYGLLDDQVRFLAGWFRDTLPKAPIERLAVLRLDGDMYESTIVALNSLYSRLSVGGYLIIDDYAVPGCKAAVNDFRAEHGIKEDLREIDWMGVFWQKLG